LIIGVDIPAIDDIVCSSARSKQMYVSDRRRHIRYLANFNGLVEFGETYAHSFAEVQSQLEDAFYNVELINIQFLE
jgi:hypothetical protein